MPSPSNKPARKNLPGKKAPRKIAPPTRKIPPNKTETLYPTRKKTSHKTTLRKSHKETEVMELKLIETKRIYYCSFFRRCIWNFFGDKKFSITNANCKSGLTEKDFFATIFPPKIWEKISRFVSSSFCSFPKNLKGFTIKRSLNGRP